MIIIIPVAIVIFGVLAYKKWSPILLAPFMALLTCFVCNLPAVDTMLNTYMPSVADFVSANFFIFFLGALFGGVMEVTGAAQSIAVSMSKLTRGRFVLPLIMTITGILAYGGVAGFVVYFSVYPIALHLCKEANISRALIPGTIYAGCWSWAMSMPGAPSVPNVMPMKYMGTDSMADAVPGFLFAGLLLYAMVFVYLEWQTHVYAMRGETFTMDEHVAETMANAKRNNLPNPILSLIPLVMILVLFNVVGLAIETSLLIGVLSGFVLLFKFCDSPSKWLETFNKSASNSAVIILNTAMVIGFAGVIKVTTSFENLVAWLGTLSMPPLVYVAVTVALCAAAAASASGGIGVALTTFQDTYLSMGIAPEVIHRLATVTCGTLDSLPHTGGVCSLLSICHQTHKEAFLHMFVTCTIMPMIASAGIIIWHTVLG